MQISSCMIVIAGQSVAQQLFTSKLQAQGWWQKFCEISFYHFKFWQLYVSSLLVRWYGRKSSPHAKVITQPSYACTMANVILKKENMIAIGGGGGGGTTSISYSGRVCICFIQHVIR